MKKILHIVSAILCFTAPLKAQTPQTKGQFQLFAGYSLMRANVREYYKSSSIVYSVNDHWANLSGWDIGLTENVKKWFGGTLDVSGNYKSPVLQGITTSEKAYSLLYGPHFFYPGHRFVPFAHVLGGVTHVSAAVPAPGPNVSGTSFALAPGAGLDVRVGRVMSIRVIQAEYFHTDFQSASKNQLRGSAGVVFDLNKK